MKQFNKKIALGAFACTALLSSSVLQAADPTDPTGAGGAFSSSDPTDPSSVGGESGSFSLDEPNLLDESFAGTIAAIAADCGTDDASTDQINSALSALNNLQIADIVDAYDTSGCSGMQDETVDATNYSVPLLKDVDGIQTLGDSTQDLVFTPVTPCRIIDTRNYGPGQMSANETRDFYVYGPDVHITPQGGQAGGCPSPQGEPAAVLLNVTPLTVAGGSAGNIQVYPYNTTPPAAAFVHYKLNTSQVTIDDNAGVFKTHFQPGPREITIKAKNSKGNVVVNVMGYYYPVNKRDYAINLEIASNSPGALAPVNTCYYTGLRVGVAVTGPGYVHVTQRVTGRNESHVSGSRNYMSTHIDRSSGVCPISGDNYYRAFLNGSRQQFDGSVANIHSLHSVTNNRVYKVTTPGTYYYYTNVYNFDADAWRIYESSMIGKFYPDGY